MSFALSHSVLPVLGGISPLNVYHVTTPDRNRVKCPILLIIFLKFPHMLSLDYQQRNELKLLHIVFFQKFFLLYERSYFTIDDLISS